MKLLRAATAIILVLTDTASRSATTVSAGCVGTPEPCSSTNKFRVCLAWRGCSYDTIDGVGSCYGTPLSCTDPSLDNINICRQTRGCCWEYDDERDSRNDCNTAYDGGRQVAAIRAVSQFQSPAPNSRGGFIHTECFEDGVCIAKACPAFSFDRSTCSCTAYRATDDTYRQLDGTECNSCDYSRTSSGSVCSNVDCTNQGIGLVDKATAIAELQGGVCTTTSTVSDGSQGDGAEDAASSQDGGSS